MPLKQGYSKTSIAHNIGLERRKGRSKKQAVAIALAVARKAARAAGKPWKAPRKWLRRRRRKQ